MSDVTAHPPKHPRHPKHPPIALTWPMLLIAADKLIKGAALVALGISLLVLDNQTIADTLAGWAHFLHIAPGNHYLLELIDKMLNLPRPTMRIFGFACFLYATLYFVEGIGLLMRRHWAEWVIVISTATFIPVEIIEIFLHFGWIKVLVFILNVVILIYLIYTIRRQHKARKAATPPLASPQRGVPPL